MNHKNVHFFYFCCNQRFYIKFRVLFGIKRKGSLVANPPPMWLKAGRQILNSSFKENVNCEVFFIFI